MSRFVAAGAAGVALLALASGDVFAAERSALQVDLVPVAAKSRDDFLGALRFTMTNTSAQTIRVPSWQTPFLGVEADLFSVSFGKDEIEYVGMLAKRAAPAPEDFIEIRPGQRKSILVDLSEVYDLSRSGQYVIQFRTNLQFASAAGVPLAKANGAPVRLESSPTTLFVDGSDQFIDAPAEVQQSMGVKALQAPTFARCTTTQQSQLVTALDSARTYGNNSSAYMNANTQGLRYTTWFGAYNSGRYATVDSHFDSISYTLNNERVDFDCSCKKRGTYAYVYPNQPYRVYLCGAFWSAPNIGADSRAGTIIHEVSHFDIVANTDDVVYGMTGAKNLASTDPAGAVRNADNHEYFSENTAQH